MEGEGTEAAAVTAVIGGATGGPTQIVPHPRGIDRDPVGLRPMGQPLRLGLKLGGQDTTADDLRSVWRIADEAGFDHVWCFDHFAAFGAGGSGRPVFEG